MLKELSFSDPHLSYHYREISQAATIIQAQNAFSEASVVLRERAALMLYPLAHILETMAFDEKALAAALTQSLLNLFKTKTDPRSKEICAQLRFGDQDAATLSRFAKQIAFEEACIKGQPQLVEAMLREDEGLLITGQIIEALIEKSRQPEASLLLMNPLHIEIMGLNMDPSGVTQAVLKLDKYEEAFPLPQSSSQLLKQACSHSQRKPLLLLQQFISIEKRGSNLPSKAFSHINQGSLIRNFQSSNLKINGEGHQSLTTTSIPFTYSLLLKSLTPNKQFPLSQAVNILLANNLPLQTSFLLHTGVTPRLSHLTTALNFSLYPFAVQFVALFLRKIQHETSTQAVTMKQCLLWHFASSPSHWELLLFVMGPFIKQLDFNQKRIILKTLKEKLSLAMEGRENFMLQFQNPIKVSLLLIQLIQLKLRLSEDPYLRADAQKILILLSSLSRRMLLLERGESETRGVLTDTDLRGRDVVSLISLNKTVDLFEHKYIEKLADEAWDGPNRVNRSLLWLNTSWIALSSLNQPTETLEDPFQRRISFSQEKRHPRWQVQSVWGFEAWKKGFMVRYLGFILFSLAFTLYYMGVLLVGQYIFQQEIYLQSQLFTPTLDASVLDSRVSYSCSGTWSYEISREADHQEALTFYRTQWGEEKFVAILQQSRDYVCWGNFYYDFMDVGVLPINSYVLMIPYTYLMKICFLRRNKRPLRHLLCSDFFYFDLMLFGQMTWFLLFLLPTVAAENEKLTESVQSVKEFFLFLTSSPIIQPYFIGLLFFMFLLRFFFSLKVTRLFGPFTKLLKLNAQNLLIWLLFTSLLLLAGSLYFSTLLSQSVSGCSGTYSCLKTLVEVTVGRVLFQSTDSFSHFSLGLFTLLSGIILVNMVIAKINGTYQEVVRKGTLYYYKDLFDQRPLYSLDSKYGFLVALEHPLSALLSPTLCIVKYLERRQKRSQQKQAQNKKKFLLNQEASANQIRIKTWRCCLCCKCKKISPYPGMQLEDFNHAMLRGIYAFYLFFFTLLVFLLGVSLTPLGYLASLFIKLRLLLRDIVIGFKHETFMCQSSTRVKRSKLPFDVLQVGLFFFFGLPRMLVQNFKDTIQFTRECWRERSDQQTNLISSLPLSSSPEVDERELFQLQELALRIMHQKEEQQQAEDQLPTLVKLTQQIASPPLSKVVDWRERPTEPFLVAYLQQQRRSVTEKISLLPYREAVEFLRSMTSSSEIAQLRKIARFLYKWERVHRATLPFFLPLSIIQKLTLGVIDYRRSQKTLRMLSRGQVQVNAREEEEQQTEGSWLILFNDFAFHLVGKEERYASDSVSRVKMQKIIDATEHLKIELEREEALKKIEKNLEDIN